VSTTAVRKTLDVSHLPETTFDSSGVLWWGNCLMFLIEGTTFAIVWASYAYLGTRNPDWPTGRDEMPRLLWGNLSTLAALVVALGAWKSDRIARRRQLIPTRRALFAMAALGVAVIALRAVEIKALAFRWDSHAYGSIVWVALVMHLCHQIACTLESAVLGAALVIGPQFDKHIADARVTSLYWYFLTAMWLPTWAIVYLAPRYLAP
jgi:heme/copper-type cytochrome/quinol oxidase subunit 3